MPIQSSVKRLRIHNLVMKIGFKLVKIKLGVVDK